MNFWLIAAGAAGTAVLAVAAVIAHYALKTRRIAAEAERLVPAAGSFVTVGQNRIHYVEKGEGPPILFIHGLGANLHHFRHPLFDAFGPGYRLIALDRPGSGYSVRAAGATARLPEQAAVIAGFIEALGLEKYLRDLGIKRADFLAVNTDWGRGAVAAFGDTLKKSGASVGAVEFMDQAATDMNAQITKVKAGSADTLFLTTSVEQITLVLKQAQEQRLTRKVITTGGSSSPSQLIKQAGAAAEGTYHILFFLPWFPEAMPDGKLAKAFVDEWAKRGHPFEGLTEGFRGHDGVLTAVEGIRVAGKADPKAVQAALWRVNVMGLNGPIKFEKDGPAGKESGQSKPSIFIVQVKDGKIALPAFAAKK